MKKNNSLCTQDEIKYAKKLNKVSRILMAAAIILLFAAVAVWVAVPDNDTIKYEGEKYVLLEYPENIFYYDMENGVCYEEDEIYPLESDHWNLIGCTGDVYCLKDEAKLTAGYYGDDSNYSWSVIIDDEATHPVNFTQEELDAIYSMENMEKEKTLFFEELEKMGSLKKISKDGMISATISLGYYEGDWYWRTERIDESQEKDGTWPEYVCKLPVSLEDKIESGFLVSTEYWWHYDEVTGESEKMSFSDDYSFYWGCECGEPIGASDMYELYDYDTDNQVIKLYNGYDDTSMEMKVMDYSDYHLLLDIDGEIKDYTYLDSDIYIENAEAYLAGYSIYSTIVDGNEETAVIGPFNYDGDVKYPDSAMKSYKLADNIEFYDLQITTVLKDDMEEQDVTYKKLSAGEGISRLSEGFGFIWLNDKLEIEKVTYYGALEISE